MAVFRAFEKFSIWGVRFFQLCFAIILTGVFAWFVHECHNNGFAVLRQIEVPLAFSVLAIFVTFFSIISVCFLGRTLQWVAAILDIVIFIGYIVSAVLYRHNYNILGYKNQLRNYLIAARQYGGENDSDHIRITNLVRLGAALIIIQIILFFITMVLSVMAARSKSNSSNHVATEKRSRFGRRNNHVNSSMA